MKYENIACQIRETKGKRNLLGRELGQIWISLVLYKLFLCVSLKTTHTPKISCTPIHHHQISQVSSHHPHPETLSSTGMNLNKHFCPLGLDEIS